jgi:hypothetical protein
MLQWSSSILWDELFSCKKLHNSVPRVTQAAVKKLSIDNSSIDNSTFSRNTVVVATGG